MTEAYAIHPACAAWPRPSLSEFKKLVADIKANGLINPVWRMPDGVIIDGKTRLAACGEAGVEPRFETYDGDDPVGFTISQNERRRHMIPAKLALIGEELAQIKNGGDRRSKQFQSSRENTETAGEIADQLGISPKLIYDARVLKLKAEPRVIQAVENGELGIKNAAAYARRTPRERQREDSIQEIKSKGNAMRTPNKPKVRRDEKTIPLATVIEEIRPFVKRIREQSKRHEATVSFAELAIIAGDLQIILERWEIGDMRPGRWPRPPRRQATGQQLGG
jgi:ParB-like chromosome segregation protein Spo0J